MRRPSAVSVRELDPWRVERQRGSVAGMKLFGSTTSPFVRRVRVVAQEVGLACELINSATDDGQAALRKVSPIGKVPVAVLDGRTIFDSRAIIEWLTTTRGFGGLAPSRDRFIQLNHVNAIDGALESAIQVFYLRREGLEVQTLALAARQNGRVATIFDWLGEEIHAGRLGKDLGLAELSLLCTLDWMEFRDIYPVARHTASFGGLRASQAERPSLASTRPHA